MMNDGWVVQAEDGKILHVREAVQPNTEAEDLRRELEDQQAQVRLQLEEEPRPGQPYRRIGGKQPLDGQPRLPQPGGQQGATMPTAGGTSSPSSTTALGTASGAAGPGGVAGETAGAGDARPGGAVIWRDDPLAIPISTTSSSSKGARTLRVEAGDEGALAAVDIEPHYQGARWLSVQELEDSWGDQQGCLQEQLLGCINQVPTTEEQGAVQGELVNHLLGWRDEIEGQLMELSRVAKAQQIRLCALQAQDRQAGEGEQVLQTMTVPLSEVRENADAWRPLFQYEYDVLVKGRADVWRPSIQYDAPRGGKRVAKLAACLAGCAAMTWPSYTAKAAVAAALAIGLAYQLSRGFNRGFWTRSLGECSTMSDREIQQELRSTEHSTRLQPRLCALRPSPAREEQDQQGSEQRTSQENIRNVQEARNSSASGRAPPPGERVSETEGPGGFDRSLEAPNSTVFEVEAANASHGVWGRIQMRLPAVFRGGREWLGGDQGQPEEVRYTNSRVTQEAMDAGIYDVTRPPMVVTSEGIRTLRPEEVDMETQTIRLIPNERLVVKSPPPAKCHLLNNLLYPFNHVVMGGLYRVGRQGQVKLLSEDRQRWHLRRLWGPLWGTPQKLREPLSKEFPNRQQQRGVRALRDLLRWSECSNRRPTGRGTDLARPHRRNS